VFSCYKLLLSTSFRRVFTNALCRVSCRNKRDCPLSFDERRLFVVWKLIVDIATVINAIDVWFDILYYLADCLTSAIV